MKYFLHTTETIPEGVGFTHYDTTHLLWLLGFVIFALISCIVYIKSDEVKRSKIRQIFAFLLIADEFFKVIMLVIGGNYLPSYLPLHLCSINIILIAIHAFKPSKMLDNFLYFIGIPAAAMALLFPSWEALPLGNFMHIHSFSVHILLITYPIMCLSGGDILPKAKNFLQCLLFLLILAVPIYIFNIFFDTNFMFLMYADPGNPLYWFGENWGYHLLGIPPLMAIIFAVMFIPVLAIRKIKNK